MDRKELFARLEWWSIKNNFWKTDGNDWEDIFQPLLDKGFTFEEALDTVETILGLAKQEYGE